MELENTINNTDFVESEAGKQAQFPNLIVAAAILFAINVAVLAFFYFSPNVLRGKSKTPTDDQYAISKASAFEERVHDTRFVPRPVEKVRPVIQASLPANDPALNPDTYADASANAYATSSAYAGSTQTGSSYQAASFSTTMNAGGRPATASLSGSNRDDAVRPTHVAAAIPAGTSDF